MEEAITEKKYPIRTIWVFKQFFMLLVTLVIVICVFIGIGGAADFSVSLAVTLIPFLFILLLAFAVPLIGNIVSRSNFHYFLDEKFMTLHQGFISKQQRNVPYGVIQGIFVHQTLFDKIFGLASLTLEDFSQGGRSPMNVDGYVGYGRSKREALGFVGNKIHIPGLKKADAEELKAIILQKVKENPISDSQSGL